MKIRSLLLGSAAIAGLSTVGYAADLGVVTSLDVCDELGLSGLTISSDDNCLVITGNVAFEYDWGDYDPALVYGSFANSTGNNYTVNNADGVIDSNSGDVDSWLKFVGTADSDFGPATATIKLVSNNVHGTGNWSNNNREVGIGEAWVGIGDTTMLMAGYKSSIFNKGDDVPLNYLGLFNSSSVNTGVGFATKPATGGDVIQIVSNLGNGLSIGGGLEGLGNAPGYVDGVGVIQYSGDGVTAHGSIAVDTLGVWAAHAGFTGAWDPIKVVAAVSADSSGYWNALGSVAATFDMFTLAGSGEATSAGEWGVGGSATATVTDGVTINLGGRYFHGVVPAAYNVWQAEAGVSAAVTETITLTGAVGATDSTLAGDPLVFYGTGGLAWAPGGGFAASTSLTVNSLGAYKAVFKASKSIK
jgi:hypothetical protein